MTTYRSYSLTAHKFGVEIKNTLTGDHCGYSDSIDQAKSVIDEIMELRRTGKARGAYSPR